MITMTTNQKYFGILAVIFSIAFFYVLNSALQSEMYGNIWLYAVAFGSLLFFSGLLLGYKDRVRESRNDLGFQYHLTTFIVVNIIGVSWLFLSMGINLKSIVSATFQCLFWGLGLYLHYYFSSKSIKGISKEELFD